MPDNCDEPSPASREARTRRSWWHKANHFIISNCGMYETGDNTKLNISDYHINAHVVLIGTQPTPGTSCVEQGGVQETGRPQSYRPERPVDQDSLGSRGEEPQITLPPKVPAAQDNGFRDEKRKITLVQSPSLYYFILSWFLSIYEALRRTSNIFTLPSRDLQYTFQSEARAEYTDPDAPSDSSTSYPYTSRARTHIYSFEMLTHRAGYPLYMPTPLRGLPIAYRKKGIRVGDVGAITANGAFDFLFNACQYSDNSDAGINPVILPNGFESLRPLIRISDMFYPGICLPSDRVREISDGNLLAFQCLAAEGAVLVLPKGATVYEAANKHDFQSHAARHAVSWYQYMLEEGRDISNGSLYFVTECIKSVNWGIGVFYAHPVADDHLRFIVNERSCRWERRGKVDVRVGPNPKDITVSDDEEPNQCVFLRGYKIMLRPDIWDKLKGAVAVTSQDGECSSPRSTRTTRHSPRRGKSGSQTDSSYQSSSDNSNTPSSSDGRRLASQLMHTQTPPDSPTQVTDVSGPETSSHWPGQVILEEKFREEAPLHPSDLINLMLLHLKPEAKVALAHDSEWCIHLPQDFITDPVNPNVDGLLENIKRSCNVAIDENDSAVLVNAEMESKAEHNLRRVSPLTTSIIFTPPDSPTEVLDAGNTFEKPELTVEEPEVTVEYTYPDVPNSSTSRARTHIYSSEMLTHRAGHPLYMPTPLRGLPRAYKKKGVRVGDVGVIAANGAFDFFFNACQYHDQSEAAINPDVLPDDFELLKSRIIAEEKFGPGSHLPSVHVNLVCEISDGYLSDFQCLAHEGAVLVLPKGATHYEAANRDHFQMHAARHAMNWYKYMLDEGRDISNGSLYFVTECIKSVNWAIAVFSGRPKAGDHLCLIVNEGSCRWEQWGGDNVEARVGPDPNDICASEDEESNQCVFLRGYKITVRSDIWDKLKSTVPVTSRDPSTRAKRRFKQM